MRGVYKRRVSSFERVKGFGSCRIQFVLVSKGAHFHITLA